MANKNKPGNIMGNMKQPVQGREEQSTGMQNQGKQPMSGQTPGKKGLGQGTVAGSTGTGNQGKTGNPVSGK